MAFVQVGVGVRMAVHVVTCRLLTKLHNKYMRVQC